MADCQTITSINMEAIFNARANSRKDYHNGSNDNEYKNRGLFTCTKEKLIDMNLFTAIIQQSFNYIHKGVDSVSHELIKKPIDHSYKSEFINPHEIMSDKYDGFCLDGKNCLNINNPHTLIIGGSGSGKTSNVVIPSIYKSNHNLIINDPSQEIYNNTSGLLKAKDYTIKVINFSNAALSSSYNPLFRITDKSDANKIAHMLVRSVLGKGKDPFWNISASSIISLVIRAQLHQEAKYQTLSNTLHLIQQLSFDPKVFDQLVLDTDNTSIINEYKNFLAYDTKLRTSILATAVAALQIFSDNEVAKVTARDSLQIEDIRKEKLAIFIHCNISDTTYYSVLISIFFEQICKVIMSKLPDSKDRYVQIVLDEFSSMFLPSIQVVISNIRKYMGNILLLCQDYAQIENIYGALDAQAIRNNCIAKLYMAGLSYSVAKDVSQELGRFEYTKDSRHSTRELLTADEVRTIGADEAILIYGNVDPIRLKLTPYYTNPFMKLKTDITPIPLIGDAQHNEIVFI